MRFSGWMSVVTLPELWTKKEKNEINGKRQRELLAEDTYVYRIMRRDEESKEERQGEFWEETRRVMKGDTDLYTNRGWGSQWGRQWELWGEFNRAMRRSRGGTEEKLTRFRRKQGELNIRIDEESPRENKESHG
jgi:hypothetical protein